MGDEKNKGEQKRLERKAVMSLRRAFEGAEVNYLNITAMMDMMTILLVFMLINFTSSATTVNLSDVLAPPSSSTAERPQQATTITVTRTGILVEDDPVVAVVRGAVDPSQKRDGEAGYIITPLVENLKKHMMRLKALAAAKDAALEAEATILADKSMPYRLLNEVMYTAGEAGFKKYRLLLLEKKSK